jgi:hypothetical protein
LNKKELEGYYEIHHIVPKCMGGDNLDDNKVLLTRKEHFIAHLLLSRIYPDKGELISALWITFIKTEASPSSRRYEKYREEYVNMFTEKLKKVWEERKEDKERYEKYCRKISETTKKSMQQGHIRVLTRINAGSKWYTNKETGESMHWYPGNPLPDENIWRPGRPKMKMSTKQLISLHQKGKICYYYNDELKENRRFMKDEEVPEGWKKGRRIIYSRKQVWRH